MPTPKERLSHLLELAAQGAGERAHLAGEVADLLLDWPPQYPAAMRATFDALLEKIVREMEAPACAELAARFEGRDDAPLALLNEFFLCASPAMQDDLLARNEAAGPAPHIHLDGEALLSAARAGGAASGTVASIAGISPRVAAAVLRDARALATLCKGGGIARATFSAMAILTGPARSVHENFAMLTVFDRVPENGAAHLVAHWRLHAGSEAAERAA
ncbi:MAG: hypothetical protein JSR60_14640 [Proteobacteria bacterium]|nr:hypothetical protein [Pseudomonadota bacterium]